MENDVDQSKSKCLVYKVINHKEGNQNWPKDSPQHLA
jgi:hypothetical protein